MDEILKSCLRRDKLEPLCELNQNDRDYLFEHSRVSSLQPHTLITAEQNNIVYLLQGEVSILSGGFVVEKFTHADLRGLRELFNATKEQDSAVLTSHGVILEVDKALFEGLYRQNNADHSLIDADRLRQEEQQLFERLRLLLKSDNLQLPSLPEATLKIRQVINQPEVNSNDIIQIVQTDPTLSARLIKVANSPLYGTWREIRSIREAVRRLGLEATRSLTLSFSVRQLFRARSTLIKQKIRQVYEESTQVSVLAYVIAHHRADHLDPEQALLSGLLHKLGVIPILNYIDDNPGMISSIQSMQKSVINLSVPLSRIMLTQWNFDDEFIKVAEFCENWYRDTGEPADYVDVVIAARLLYLQSSNQLDESIKFEQVPVADKLGLLDIGEGGLDFFTMAKKEIDDMRQILKI